MKRLISAIVLLLLAFPAGAAESRIPAHPAFKKVMLVILENTRYQDAIRRPFLSSLAEKGAVLSNYHAVAHPSQPNYIALIAGDTLGVKDNKPAKLDGRHLGDLLDAAGKTWGVYAEGYPGGCFLGETSGRYVRKHVPFLSFRNVQNDPALCSRVRNTAALDADLAAGTLPDFSIYVPNLDNDGHDTGVARADTWMAQAFGPRIADPRFMEDLLLVITFDESADHNDDNRVLTVLIGDSIHPGAVSRKRYDHYSLLRTVEAGLGLGSLGRNDAKAKAINGVWN